MNNISIPQWLKVQPVQHKEKKKKKGLYITEPLYLQQLSVKRLFKAVKQ